MKVVIFSRYPQVRGNPQGGVEAVTLTLVRALSQFSDMELHVVTLEANRRAIMVEQDGHATVHRLPGSRWPQVLDITIGPGRRRLRRYVLGLHADILHTQEVHGIMFGDFPLPHVFTLHGYDHEETRIGNTLCGRLRSALWLRIEYYGLRRQRHVIAISPYARDFLASVTGAVIHSIENAVDEEFFCIQRHEVPGRILSVGWITERKNTLGSVEALAQLVVKRTDALLVIAGKMNSASYEARVREAIQRHNLPDRVEFLGHVSQERLQRELAKASVFLLPSFQETAPRAISEAMAAGVPVVTSNRCGMPYMVSEGDSGFLVDPDDTAQIAARVERVLTDEQLRHSMSRRSREIALARFHPNAVAARTREVYYQVVRDYQRSRH